VDAAGNVSPVVSRTWIVDTVPPALALQTGPAAGSATQLKTATFTFGADAGTQCRVDNGAFAACTSPFTTATLPDGSHTFAVRATDAAGNVNEQTRTWLVDTVAPTLALTGGPSRTGHNESTSATIVWTSGDATDPGGLTTTCELDGRPVACGPLANLSEGRHRFTVLVRDRAGNARSDAWEWIVDSRAPAITLEAAPAINAAVNAAPVLRWRADEEATYTCRVDAGAPAACAPPFTPSGLRDGFHTVVIAARDPYGHVSEVSRSFTLDTVAPETSIDDGPGEGTTVSNLFTTFLLGASEPVGGFACAVDGVASECASPFSVTLTPGAHTFEVAAVDVAGNIDPTPARRTWTIGAQARAAADADRDGVTVPTDCVDTDAAIRPGAADTPGDRVDQDCDGRDAPYATVAAALSYQWKYKGSQAWPLRFVLKSVARTSTVTVRCTGPKRACPFKAKTIKGTGKDLDLRKLVFGAKRLRAGAVVTLEVTAPNTIAKVTTFKVRKGKAPTGGTFSCRAPGAAKPTKCA
jgi:hypothetical protein